MKLIKRFFPKNFFSFIAVLLFALSANTIINTENVYDQWGTLTRFDQGGYYGYMPAILIHNDLELTFYDKAGFSSQGIMVPLANGTNVNRYAIGPAVLSSPFFLIGHELAKKSPRYIADGLSSPYKQWVLLGTIFYVSIALFFIRSVLLRYYDDIVTALTIITLGFGTNLLYYTSMQGIMSHAYSFFLFALLLFSTIKWLDDAKKKYLLLVGLSLGLIACTRLPNLVVGLIPLLWGISSKTDIKPRLELLWQQKFWILAAFLICVIGYAPQMIYYKVQTGNFFVNSYPNSRFWFDQPLPLRVLFSFRNGWLIYSPLMGLGFIGFFLIKKHCKEAFIPLLSFFIINMYVVSSWWCWWYGGSFGMRALIETSALFSLTLAASIHYLVHGKWSKYLFTLVFPLFIALSIFQSYQAHHNIIRYDGMNWEAYKFVFGQTQPAPEGFYEKRDEMIDYNFDFIKASSDKEYRYRECR